MTRIIAFDPGTVVTGYAIVEGDAAVDFGVIRPQANKPLFDRYGMILFAAQGLIEKYTPLVCVLEMPFVHENAQSALKLGVAVGILLGLAKRFSLEIFSYTPREVKKAVTGHGGAHKEQVQNMVKQLFFLPKLPEPHDAADALALALCHIHRAISLKK